MRYVAICFVLAMDVSRADPIKLSSLADGSGMSEVFDAVRTVADGKEWHKNGLTGSKVDKWLQEVWDKASKAVGLKGGIPVSFEGIRPQREIHGRRLLSALHVGGGVDLASASRSIILADGSVQISHAYDCVIVARGAVVVAHGGRNFIFAGQFIDQGFDGIAPDPTSGRSLLLCHGPIDISHAKGSVLLSPAGVRIGHANGVVVMNETELRASSETGTERRLGVDLKLAKAPNGKFAEAVLLANNEPRTSATIRLGDNQFLAEMGTPIVDASGQPLPRLVGWQLKFVTGKIAVFESGREMAVVRK
ncbi:MAG: hypothetical protein U0746_05350 [Gemmataceae bacterium]